MRFLKLIAFGIGCFLLGAYASSEFKYDKPVEGYRWVVAIMVTLYFYADVLSKNK